MVGSVRFGRPKLLVWLARLLASQLLCDPVHLAAGAAALASEAGTEAGQPLDPLGASGATPDAESKLAAGVSNAPATGADAENKRPAPHLIFIVVDDLGWHDRGSSNVKQINTEAIDTLAAGGMELTQYYVQSVCSPSRASFLTGRYPLHHTVNQWLRAYEATALPLNEMLMPQVLARAGYEAHAVGKWHLGFHRWQHTPTFRGFNSFLGLYGGGEDYYQHVGGRPPYYDLRWDARPNCSVGCSQVASWERGRYSTHVFTDRALEVIGAHDKRKPLFLYLAYQAVHAPAQVPAEYVTPYASSIADRQRRVFAGMLSCVDEGIGNVTAALRRHGLLADSVVVVTTDNGGPISNEIGDAVGSSNWPLRGGKHSIWEGGTRGTAVLYAGERTGLLGPDRRGSSFKQLMHASDWLPTFCSLAGGAAAASCASLALDGVDQGPALFHGAPSARTEVFYGQHDQGPQVSAASRDGALRDPLGWKLVTDFGGYPNCWGRSPAAAAPDAIGAESCLIPPSSPGPLLFNLSQDLAETSDVAGAHPTVVRRLAARLRELLSTAAKNVTGGGELPDPSCPPFDPAQHADPNVGVTWGPWCGSGSGEWPTTI